MRSKIKKIARRILLSSVLALSVFSVSASTVNANELIYLGTGADGLQYYISFGSSAGTTMFTYDPRTGQYNFTCCSGQY